MTLSFPPFTRAVKILIIINVAVFFFILVGNMFARGLDAAANAWFGLVPAFVTHGFIWQLVTYAFLHAGVTHILFNMLGQADLFRNGEYKEIGIFKRSADGLVCTMDYDAQQVPHRTFLTPSLEGLDKVCSDPDAMNEYLRTLFRMMYQYDMIARECGIEPDWEEEIISIMRYLWIVRTEETRVGDGWVRRFT